MTPEQYQAEHNGFFRGAIRWGMMGTRKEEWPNIVKLAHVLLQAACDLGIEEPLAIARYINRNLLAECDVVNTQRENIDSLDIGEEIPDPYSDTPLDTLLKKEDGQQLEAVIARLHKAIGELPEDLQTVVRLRLDQKTWPDIGQSLGISEALVRYRHGKAFKILRRKMRVL